MTFALLCVVLIALMFSALVAFGGYRLFLVLLPIWGFFAGLFLGAQAMTALLGQDFLGTVTGLVVGFVVGLIFAVLSYLFYAFAVAVISFSFGYYATVGILDWIGLGNLSLIVWLIAVVVGIVVVAVVFALNIQKYAIIVITAIGGTSGVIYTLLVAFGNQNFLQMAAGPVKVALNTSFWWLLFFLVMAAAGIIFQIQANRSFEVDTYNRWSDEPAM
jgi:hypothetical protein